MSEDILVLQNRVIIALLARSTMGVKQIEETVRGGKKKGHPDDFVRAYNALDGTKTVTEIARMVGITQPAMTSVLQTWEERGIVYKKGTSKQAPYVGLLKLPEKSKHRASTMTKKTPRMKATSRTRRTMNGAVGEETAFNSLTQSEGEENEERLGS